MANKHGFKLYEDGGMSFKFTLTGTSCLCREAIEDYGDYESVDMVDVIKQELITLQSWIEELYIRPEYINIKVIDIKPING